MVKVDLYISNEAPNVKNSCAWLKPVNGGYVLYVLDNGWKPLNLVEDKLSAVVGTASDSSEDMTLYGLKAYIDKQIAAIE